jgi:hypothetical protein
MRDALSRKYGQIWSSDELRARYEVLGFMAPLVVVRDRLTGQKGSLEFRRIASDFPVPESANPRIYKFAEVVLSGPL